MVEKSKAPVPEVGKVYGFFDNGIISSARYEEVTITALIPYKDANTTLIAYWKEDTEYWKEDTEGMPHLYSAETDYFVKGFLTETEEEVTFVRRVDGGWFSLGGWSGTLDWDGSLLTEMKEGE